MCKVPFTWNLSPLRPSKFSFEYLLLPPRSAPTAAPPRLTPKVSAQFGTVTRLPVHPASPVLLTKNGPLGALDSVARLNEAAAPTRTRAPAILRGTSDGNQLLDGSISLSPLYPSQDERFARQAGAGEHAGYIAETARAANHDRRDGHLHEAYRQLGLWAAAPIRTGPRPRVDRRTGYRRSTSDRDASPAPIRFPPDNFKHSLTLFSKSFSSFPRVGPGTTGALTLSGAPFQGTWARSAAEDASPDYNSDSEAVRFFKLG
ncbi:hypothetical protein L1887_62792 [Cichorium endivia]|nr:hypothetical protein L1887_62792 [Cichorium endivia]